MSLTAEWGVLTGCDLAQEWLLAWFYKHFRRHNPDLPIAFADFGMSKKGRQWCAERGVVFQVPPLPAAIAEKRGFLFQGDLWEEWKLDRSTISPARDPCFRKPFALQKSPFSRTLWLDLDCQVMGSLESLFTKKLTAAKFGATPCNSFVHVKNLSKELVFLVDKYNTGVILVEGNSPLLKSWASLIHERTFFRTDEGSLSFLAGKNQMEIMNISDRYNWPVFSWGENSEALIYHWLGMEAKTRLRALIEKESCLAQPT